MNATLTRTARPAPVAWAAPAPTLALPLRATTATRPAAGAVTATVRPVRSATVSRAGIVPIRPCSDELTVLRGP